MCQKIWIEWKFSVFWNLNVPIFSSTYSVMSEWRNTSTYIQIIHFVNYLKCESVNFSIRIISGSWLFEMERVEKYDEVIPKFFLNFCSVSIGQNRWNGWKFLIFWNLNVPIFSGTFCDVRVPEYVQIIDFQFLETWMWQLFNIFFCDASMCQNVSSQIIDK